MSYLDDKDGTPILEHHDELLLQWFHSSPQARQIILGLTRLDEFRRPFRRTADRSINGIGEIYEMIDQLIDKMQMYFIPSKKNKWLLNFPYMFVPAKIGDKFRNLETNETYTIKYVPHDAKGDFTGTVLLNTGLVSPKTHERLVYENPEGIGPGARRMIQFFHSQPPKSAADLEESSGDVQSVKREAFTPTIVVEMRRQEPGTIGKRPFDIAKEIKPRIREIFNHPADPRNYSVQIRGQWMDNILRFTCYSTSHRQCERLVEWLKTFFHRYTGVLKKNGIQEILFWQRRNDEQVEKWRDDLVGYPIEYFFRTEELHVDVHHNITTVNLNQNLTTTDLTAQVETGIEVAGGIVVGPFGDQFATLFDALHDESGNYLYGSFDIADTP